MKILTKKQKEQFEKVMNLLYILEDSTDYEIKEISDAICSMQKILPIKKEI